MKKRIISTTLSMFIALAAMAQWVPSGINIKNNNAGGSVFVAQDITNPSLANGIGALFSIGTTSHTSGTAPRMWGAYLLSLNQSTGTLTESIGAYGVGGNESSGHGVVTSAFGLKARVQAGLGSVNTGYGVYIENTAANIDYGLYQAGADDDNFFAGNVGIGTATTGGFKLAVEGKIGAREVNVTAVTPWPDYVFENNYKLPSLEELNTYIKINRHLPEVPTACAMEENGVNLGEMNMLLLKKVEELTLYVIAMKKELDYIKQRDNQAISKK